MSEANDGMYLRLSFFVFFFCIYINIFYGHRGGYCHEMLLGERW